MTESSTKRYAKLLYNPAAPRSGSIAAGTYLEVLGVDNRATTFKTPNGAEQVTEEFCTFEDLPTGTVPYGSDEPTH